MNRKTTTASLTVPSSHRRWLAYRQFLHGTSSPASIVREPFRSVRILVVECRWIPTLESVCTEKLDGGPRWVDPVALQSQV